MAGATEDLNVVSLEGAILVVGTERQVEYGSGHLQSRRVVRWGYLVVVVHSLGAVVIVFPAPR